MPGLVELSIHADVKSLDLGLTKLEKKQLPFARSQATNALAKQVVADLVKEMERKFDRPTRWVLRGIYAHTKTKGFSAEIGIKDYAPNQGTPAEKILSAEVLGGTRRLKKFERALGHSIGEGTFIVPGRGAKIDAFGNMPKSQINKVLSALGAAETSAGYNANRRAYTGKEMSERFTKGKRKGQYKVTVYFVATSRRDGRPLAVYQVVDKGHVVPIFFFPRTRPRYEPRLAFYGVVKNSVEKHARPIFTQELAKAVATAK